MKKVCTLIVSIFLIVSVAFCIALPGSTSCATELDPGTYEPGSGGVDQNFINKYAGGFSSILYGLAVLIAVIAVMFVGIKYIAVGGTTEKADYKKNLIPMAFGIIFIALLGSILSIIANIADSI